MHADGLTQAFIHRQNFALNLVRTSGMIGVVQELSMPENDRRPEITMHSLRFGGGFAGLIFTVGSMLIFLVGLPLLWSFLALSMALGIAVAAIFRWIARNRSTCQQLPSILHAADEVPTEQAGKIDTFRSRNLSAYFPTSPASASTF
jgi:hypothetical protein